VRFAAAASALLLGLMLLQLMPLLYGNLVINN